MDFSTLLNVAQKNENIAKQQNVACYKTKFTPPKKETKQSKILSDNIKKFLAKKEEEEIKKKLEEKKRKENLLSLRDQKTQNRINKHLKVCKAANKSVLADAVDNENTAITIAGPSQPDEDDYGYVSQEASEFYNRLIDKYNRMPPEKPLFSDSGERTVKDILSTKDRVKQALKQQEIEEITGHRRKKKLSKETIDGKSDKSESVKEKDAEKEKEKEKYDKDATPKIKKKPPPPPIDFVSLLKLAEKKQHEPIIIEVKPKKEEERPLTKKQQKEYQKEKEWRERKEKQKSNPDSTKPTADVEKVEKKNKLPAFAKIPKVNSEKSNADNTVSLKKTDEKPVCRKPIDNNAKNSNSNSNSSVSLKEKERQKMKGKEKVCDILEERRKLEIEKRKLEEMRRSIEEEKKRLEMSKNKSKIEDAKSKCVIKSTKDSIKKDIKPRQFPPPDVRPLKRPELKKKANKRRIESDDEYDSELDDFIVDEEEDNNPEIYSKYISEIFNYDKSKYRDYDDDDAAMESNFAQQLREEFVSTKIGIMEDLEDIRREKMIEARKKKMMMNKKMKK